MTRLRLALSFAGLLCVVAAAPLGAQQTTLKAQWDTADAPAAANGFTYALKDGTTPIGLGAVSCVAAQSGGGSVCTAPLTAPLAPGTHSLVLTASSPLGSASSPPLAGATPNTPKNLTITITVTVS